MACLKYSWWNDNSGSYGNPMQPNKGNDGGIGLTHIQGLTAKNMP